jgi:hypothetical protein
VRRRAACAALSRIPRCAHTIRAVLDPFLPQCNGFAGVTVTQTVNAQASSPHRHRRGQDDRLAFGPRSCGRLVLPVSGTTVLGHVTLVTTAPRRLPERSVVGEGLGVADWLDLVGRDAGVGDSFGLGRRGLYGGDVGLVLDRGQAAE